MRGEAVTRKEECAFCDFKDLGVLVYEDYQSYAIITRHPINPYHTLVIPRDHFVDFTDLPDDLAAHIFLTVKNISEAIRNICNPDAITHISDDDIHHKGYNLMEHYKFHIIPRFDNDKVRIDWGNPQDPGLKTRIEYASKIRALL